MKIIRKIFMVLIAFFLVELYIDSNALMVTNIDIKDSEIPKNFNVYEIMHLSDLHRKSFGENNIELLKKVESINPDVIMMTGDMVNSTDTKFDVFLNLAKTLSEKYKIYYIVGNHEEDMKEENKKIIFDFLEANGVEILDNEKVVLERENEKINLYGTWCNLRYYSSAENEERYDFTIDVMNKIMGDYEVNQDEYNILLAHNPNFIETYAKWGADLTLSGHIHGGMVRIPFVRWDFFTRYNFISKVYFRVV